jgi:hypothetical protein
LVNQTLSAGPGPPRATIKNIDFLRYPQTCAGRGEPQNES